MDNNNLQKVYLLPVLLAWPCPDSSSCNISMTRGQVASKSLAAQKEEGFQALKRASQGNWAIMSVSLEIALGCSAPR